MSFNGLPPEILTKIFRYLPRPHVQLCSSVCKQWHDVTEGLFKEFCKKDYPDTYEEAFRVADITWQELHNSLSIWPRIEAAKMIIYHTEDLDHDIFLNNSHERERQFFVLQNGIISYPQFIATDENPRGSVYRNTVLYYDSKTLRAFKKRSFKLDFNQYAENDEFIVLRGRELKVYIMPKVTSPIRKNRRLFLIGEVKQYGFGDISNFIMLKNKVYFLDKSNKLKVSQLEERDGEIIVKTEPLDSLLMECYYSIVAIGYMNDNHINILTSYGHVYSVINKEVKRAGCITEDTDRFKMVENLKKFGFDWSQQAVYDWVHQRHGFSMDKVTLSKLKDAVVCKHGNIVVLGTSRRVIHVYCNPYRRDGALKLYNSKPCFKVDLNDYYPLEVYQKYRKIEQIDVIEIPNGHRIIVLYSNKIISIEFIHETPPKRSSVGTSNCDAKKTKID